MTENNTPASGAADDSLLLCASDLQHSAIYDNTHEMVDCVRAVADRITALAASAPVAPTREAEAVRWEFRWLNPANNPCSSPSERAWKLVEPKGMQPLEAALSDLRACRYAGNPCYEVRPLFAEAAPVAPTPPDWRELCRRLYVELFHCDKQMTCSLNEDGEPIWRTGPEVRDVLSDAKAALEANPITPEAAPVAPTQPGFVLVPLEFVRGFNTLAHNYSLRAEPPDYYRGVEGDAFSSAYARCGQDLAELMNNLA